MQLLLDRFFARGVRPAHRIRIQRLASGEWEGLGPVTQYYSMNRSMSRVLVLIHTTQKLL